MATQSPSSVKRQPLPFHLNVLAGGIAGWVELFCMYPTDVVKTRAQQVVSGQRPSLFGSLRDLFKEGGVLRLYRGIAAPVVVEPIKRATKFATNEEYRKLVIGNGPSTFGKSIVCGFLAGSTEGFVIAPFELVKVRMQAKNRIGLYSNSWNCASTVFKQENVLGFYRGASSAIQRNGVWNGIYFGIVNQLKTVFPQNRSKWENMFWSFVSGLIGGTIGTIANTPWDVVASRVRNVLPGEQSPYKFTFPSMILIVKNEGISALWRGFVAKVARLGPGGGIMIVVFDGVSEILRRIV